MKIVENYIYKQLIYFTAPCAIGERFNTNTQVCEKCPLNYYQHSEGQFSCTLCPNGRYTDNVGSISETFCKSKYNSTKPALVTTCIKQYYVTLILIFVHSAFLIN
jgi:hypothetical protein